MNTKTNMGKADLPLNIKRSLPNTTRLLVGQKAPSKLMSLTLIIKHQVDSKNLVLSIIQTTVRFLWNKSMGKFKSIKLNQHIAMILRLLRFVSLKICLCCTLNAAINRYIQR